MPRRAIARKKCRVMVEPPENDERATLNSNLSTRLKPTPFRSGPEALLPSFSDAQLRSIDAPLGAVRESILIIVVMDSQMCNCTS